MNSRRDIDIIKKMAEYCNEISETVEFFGDSFELLSSNKIYKNAVAMCILQIGELAGHLSDDFKAIHSEMPWQDMKSMRNVAAHGYGKLDLEMLWGTITTNIPGLWEFCARVVEQEVSAEPDKQ